MIDKYHYTKFFGMAKNTLFKIIGQTGKIYFWSDHRKKTDSSKIPRDPGNKA